MPVDDARAILDEMDLPYESDWGAGRLMKTVYDEKAQHMVRGPLFCLDYPQEVSPLARAHRSEAGSVERFELIVGGHELCNAYSEQNNPVLQLRSLRSGGSSEGGRRSPGGRRRPGLRARVGVRHAVHRRAWAWASTGW